VDLTGDQLLRYSRHLVLPEVGDEGQAKLLRSRVLVIGAGGLGSPLILYLAAAGVGTIGVVDFDRVDPPDLQRQITHTTERLGQPKVESAQTAVAELNPDVRFEAHETRLTAENAAALAARYDLVADGSDNFPTRFLVNDACFFAGRTLVSAAVARFDGQLATYKAHEGGDDRPCYRCLFPEIPADEAFIPNCEQAGVLGSVAGVMGTLQATEVLKELLGRGSLAGALLIYDALAAEFRRVRVRRDPACPLCGEHPRITDLSAHAA
jgi:molybdopterin-synthase adenylyltransferase